MAEKMEAVKEKDVAERSRPTLSLESFRNFENEAATTVDFVSKMTVNDMKNYLRDRGWRTDHSPEQLTMYVLIAISKEIPIVVTKPDAFLVPSSASGSSNNDPVSELASGISKLAVTDDQVTFGASDPYLVLAASKIAVTDEQLTPPGSPAAADIVLAAGDASFQLKTMSEIMKEASKLSIETDSDCDWGGLFLKLVGDFHTPEVCALIEENTRGQSAAPAWKEQRLYRITASKCGDVVRKVAEIKKKGGVDKVNKPVTATFWKTCFASSNSRRSWQMEYGSDFEEVAKKKYFEDIKKESSHVNPRIRNVGFHIHPTMPYFGASPDAIFTCDCCGNKLIEIKCPATARDAPLLDVLDKIKYLKEDLTLKENSKEFFQCLAQMGICNIHCLDFVVYTPEKLYIQTLDFSRYATRWADLEADVKYYYTQVLLREMYIKCQNTSD